VGQSGRFGVAPLTTSDFTLTAGALTSVGDGWASPCVDSLRHLDELQTVVGSLAHGGPMTEQQIYAKCAWRLMPLIIALYVFNYMDRTNVGFAALTMNKDLGLSLSVYGLGAGILFVTFALFQVPANIILDRIGARRWMFCILAVWGAISTSNAFIRGPTSFYLLRLLLGAAESRFVSGILLYLSYWFPQTFIGRVTAMFMAASILSLAIGGPLAA
jgi:ACS family tartrate transporter-like MFS transporter